MKKIFMFAGFAQHGKDTAASIAQEYLFQKGYTSTRISFGDYLKFVAEKYFYWDGKKDNRGRTLLQQLGTEKGRENNPRIWASVVANFIKGFHKEFDYIIIPDFRFPNEYETLYESGFKDKLVTAWIFRKDFDNGLTDVQKNHPSETSLLDFSFNSVILVPNNKIEKLVDSVHALIDREM